MSRPRRAGLPALALLFLLTACAEEPPPQTSTADQAMLTYAQCMRDNGVAVPDPRDGEPASLYEGVDTSSAAFDAADQQCAQHLAGVVQERQGQDPQQQQEMNDALLKIAQCLREHGLDVPDPVPGQEGGPFGDELDRNDPATAQALQECQG